LLSPPNRSSFPVHFSEQAECAFLAIKQLIMRRTAPAFAQAIRILDSSGKVERSIPFSEADRKL